MKVAEAGTRAEDRREGAVPGARFREALRRAGERREPGTDREEAREPERAGGRAECARASPGEPGGGEAATPELRALVRALPPAIDASRVRAGEPLALSFGRSIDVEVRAGPAGIEVVIRPAPPLARAAAAEVPGIVAALRSRGLAVARAEVRARSGAAGSGREAAR